MGDQVSSPTAFSGPSNPLLLTKSCISPTGFSQSHGKCMLLPLKAKIRGGQTADLAEGQRIELRDVYVGLRSLRKLGETYAVACSLLGMCPLASITSSPLAGKGEAGGLADVWTKCGSRVACEGTAVLA